MRTLYICRHAKSSWAIAGQEDHARPLNERGFRDAPSMALRFKNRGEPIDRMVSSDATRALATAKAFVKELGMDSDRFRVEPRLYHATAHAIKDVCEHFPDEDARVMIFGHNPGLSDLVRMLCDEDIGELPTCGLVRIDFTLDQWAAIARGSGTLVWFDYPKRMLSGDGPQ